MCEIRRNHCFWAAKMNIKPEENYVENYPFAQYVDDLNIYVEAIKLGSRWDREKVGKTECEEKWENEDI